MYSYTGQKDLEGIRIFLSMCCTLGTLFGTVRHSLQGHGMTILQQGEGMTVSIMIPTGLLWGH